MKYFIVFFISLALFSQCSDENATPKPTLTGFTPSSGVAGTIVTITGTNFSATPSENLVKFNGVDAIVTGASATSLTAAVPPGATDGQITVMVSGVTLTSASSFDVLPTPTLAGFSPTSGVVGTTVTITGTNFSTTPSENLVRFNGVDATVTESSATSLTVTVPAGATDGLITVMVSGVTLTSVSDFDVFTLETPLATFMDNGTWNYTLIDNVDRSIGNKFSVLTNGEVTALGLNSLVAGTFDVALYEVAAGNTPTLIGSTSVTITQTEIDADPEMFKFADLDNAVSVITGKTYCVAYTTNATSQNRLDEGGSNPEFTLPIEANNSQVSILTGVYGTADAFPENDQAGVIFMADVKFKY